jgi:hypothetical protein
MPGWLADATSRRLELGANSRWIYQWRTCRYQGETEFLMRVNRRFLYAGTFLLALGGVLVLADLGANAGVLTDLVRLWPLAIVALGAALVVRRTQFGLAGGMLAAALPGLVLGGAFTAIPRLPTDCASLAQATPIASERGQFTGPATISLTTSCGLLEVDTAQGNGWTFEAASTLARQPVITSTADSLSIDTGAHDSWPPLDAGRSAWDLTVPTSDLDELLLVTYTGQSRINLAGADIARLELSANASDMNVDASGAAVATLSAVVNVGALSIDLPAESDLDGTIRLGGGELKLCAPPELGLRVTSRGQPREVNAEGFETEASEWESDNYDSATHHADLRVNANFGAVTINPIGGCK